MIKLILALWLPFLFASVSPVLAAEPSPDVADGPSVVKVVHTDAGAYQYLVNGQPQYFVGMGYNAIYRYLSDEERAARYDVDFRRLRAIGVNTITGWDADKGYEQDKFDQLTLDKAYEYGLGVVMPFYLPAEGEYEDPDFREQLKADLAAKVIAYRDHPALRMWGIGNEVIEGVLASGQVEALVEFYPELAELAHTLDPNHPVIYREADEVYLQLLTWYDRENAVEDPWLLYGMNAYTFRLRQILADWPALSYGMPVFISEFAPEGFSPADRPAGYVRMWRMIRAHPDYVLGGAPYVWTQEGPEPVDEHFGLVTAEGEPADGSLAALAREFRRVN